MLNFRAGERAHWVKGLLRKHEDLPEFDPQPPPLGDKDRQVSGAHWPANLTEATNSSSSEHSSRKIRGTGL